MSGMIFGSICGTIGRTPLIRLNRLTGEGCAEILVKCESFNPGGSVKDRIALAMIEDAEKSGRIKAGTTLVEPTSGNTGIGLAMVAAQKGYPLILVMPDTMTVERRRLVQAYGAKIVLTPGSKGMKGAITGAKKLLAEIPGSFQPSQFDNPSNPEVHSRTTAQEIMADTEGRLDAFVAGVGTGGTVTGVGRVIRERIGKSVLIVAVEPKDSPVLSGGQPGPHKIQGIGAGFIPDNYDSSVVDRIVQVSYEDSVETARRLGKEEAILSGISTGAILHTALGVARELGAGKRVVAIVCDTGERYLSTPLFAYEEPEMLALE
jgi:cysteine synthase A